MSAIRLLILAACGLVLFTVPPGGCKIEGDCESTEAPTFNVSLSAGGGMSVLDAHGASMSVIPADTPVSVQFRKFHCSGSVSGAMTYDFLSDAEGHLRRAGIGGTWSIHVDNTEDKVLVDLLVDGEVRDSTAISYDQLLSCSQRLNYNVHMVFSHDCDQDFEPDFCETSWTPTCT